MATVLSLHQPNYLPWTGYLSKIAHSDIFVYLDNVQFPRGITVANRTKLRSKIGEEILLSVPIKRESGGIQYYSDLRSDETQKWRKKHIKTIEQYYSKAPYYKDRFSHIQGILMDSTLGFAQMNMACIDYFVKLLELKTKIHKASEISEPVGKKSQRIVDICKYFNADVYLSGNGAKKYNDEVLYNSNRIKLVYTSFKALPYPQLGEKFIANLSILDLILNCDIEESRKHIGL